MMPSQKVDESGKTEILNPLLSDPNLWGRKEAMVPVTHKPAVFVSFPPPKIGGGVSWLAEGKHESRKGGG